MPPTNYSFGGGRVSARPSSGVIQPKFSASTTDRLSGITRTPIAQRAQDLSNMPEENVASQVATKNQEINSFGTEITAMKQAAARRQRESVRMSGNGGAAGGNAGMVALNQPEDYSNYRYQGPATGARKRLVEAATSLLGTPYAWGGGGYGNRSSRGVGKGTQNVVGVDCSGLTSYAYSTLGIRIPRTARQQGTIGYRTSIKNLKPGDLVVWNNGSHTSMYIGNGQIIESPNVGKTVRIRNLRPGEAVTGIHLALPGE